MHVRSDTQRQDKRDENATMDVRSDTQIQDKRDENATMDCGVTRKDKINEMRMLRWIAEWHAKTRPGTNNESDAGCKKCHVATVELVRGEMKNTYRGKF